MAGSRKYAVQKPKGNAWETLALVEDIGTGRQEFNEAIRHHGKGYVRLIQVDFNSEEALSDFDWRLIELHDPFKTAGGRSRPTVVAGSEKPRPPKKPAPAAKAKGPPGPGENVPVPYGTYTAAILVGALAVVLWAFFYEF